MGDEHLIAVVGKALDQFSRLSLGLLPSGAPSASAMLAHGMPLSLPITSPVSPARALPPPLPAPMWPSPRASPAMPPQPCLSCFLRIPPRRASCSRARSPCPLYRRASPPWVPRAPSSSRPPSCPPQARRCSPVLPAAATVTSACSPIPFTLRAASVRATWRCTRALRLPSGCVWSLLRHSQRYQLR